MKSTTTVLFLLLIGLAIIGMSQAGDLEPPGAPAPTMVTLQEIYDRVSASPVGIAKTGQTDCYDTGGTVISCTGTGQDGEYQNGVSVDPRFTDNDDGTVTDNLTGLIWLQDANCFGQRNWTNALSDANTLADGSCGLTDGSVAGDWRLPNVRELHSLIDYSQYNKALPPGHPFSGVVIFYYWSSTSVAAHPHVAWQVYVYDGLVVNAGTKTANHYVWPVRGGL